MRSIGSLVVRNTEIAQVVAHTEDGRVLLEKSQGGIEVCDSSWSDFPFKIGDLVQTNDMCLQPGKVTSIYPSGSVIYDRPPCGGGDYWYNLHIVKDDFKVGDLVTTPGWNKQTYAEIISIRDTDVECLRSDGQKFWIAKSCLLKFEAREPWWPGAFITYIKALIYAGKASDFKMRLMADGKGVEWVCVDGKIDALSICPNIFNSASGNLRLMTPTEIRDAKKYFEKEPEFKTKTIYKVEVCYAEWHDGAFHYLDGSVEKNKSVWTRFGIVEAKELPNVEKVAMEIQRVGGSSIGWWNLSIESRKDWRKTARAACETLNVAPNGLS